MQEIIFVCHGCINWIFSLENTALSLLEKEREVLS